MMHLTDITGLAGIALAIPALALRLPIATQMQTKQRAWLAGAIFIAVVLPFGGLSVVELARGITGDLSIITLVLLAIGLRQAIQLHSVGASPARELLKSREQGSLLQQGDGFGFKQTLLFVALAALALYPFALGIGMFDPYRLGFGNLWFIAGLLVVALAAWFRQRTLIALCISLAVLAWSIGWYESNNLWDYLIDPWVSIYALSAMIRLGWVSLRGWRH